MPKKSNIVSDTAGLHLGMAPAKRPVGRPKGSKNRPRALAAEAKKDAVTTASVPEKPETGIETKPKKPKTTSAGNSSPALIKARDYIDKLHTSLGELRERNRDLTSEIAVAEAKYRDEHKDLKQRALSAYAEAQEWKDKYDALLNDMTEVAADNAKTEQENLALKEKCHDLNTTIIETLSRARQSNARADMGLDAIEALGRGLSAGQ